MRTRQRVESLKTYPEWSSRFNDGGCPAILDVRDWTAEFRNGQPLDWIVRNAFTHNRGLFIDLIFGDGQRGTLKRIEWRLNGETNILWSA
jgi:hypothetical protein